MNIVKKEILSAKLNSLNPPLQLEFYDEIDSTNTQAKKLISTRNLPFLVVAKSQKKGRGRLDRTWVSQVGSSLCMSVVCQLPSDTNFISSFSIRVGMAICSQLSQLLDTKLLIKWPNDIYSCQGKKIGGILCELNIGKNSQISAIVGVGINCFASRAGGDFNNIPYPIDSLENVSKNICDINEICASVSKAILNCVENQPTENLSETFKKFDWLYGREIELDTGNKVLHGIASSVDNAGRIGLSIDGKEPIYLSALEAKVAITVAKGLS